MFDTIVGYLHNVNAGDALMFLASVAFAGTWIYKWVRKVIEGHRNVVESDLKKKEEYKNLIQTVDTIKEEFVEFKKTANSSFDEIKKVLDKVGTESDEGDEALGNKVKTVHENVNKHAEQLATLESNVSKLTKQVNSLLKNDKDFCRTYIAEGHSTYVKEKHAIGLVTLQALESMYNDYIKLLGPNEQDEFTAKLMNDLRNLPTSFDS